MSPPRSVCLRGNDLITNVGVHTASDESLNSLLPAFVSERNTCMLFMIHAFGFPCSSPGAGYASTVKNVDKLLELEEC